MRRYRNRKKNKQRKIIIISACSILLLMTAGYAAMQTNLEINAKGNVIKKITGGEQLLETVNIVTNGDGLYKDAYEENVYTYRGGSPNNYVTFNNELWRIISINTSDNTIKIIRNEILEDKEYDYNNNRYSNNGYCNVNNYCNIWGSASTMFDSNMKPINALDRYYYGYSNNTYPLPSKEASLNIYLNEEYYNILNENARNMIKEDGVYKIGVLDYNNASINQDMQQVSSAKWKGKIALIDATEYVRASTNSSCTDIHSAVTSTGCSINNWMFDNNIWWTLSPHSGTPATTLWYVGNGGAIYGKITTFSYGVRPVITLKPEVKITSGTGEINSPFTFEI